LPVFCEELRTSFDPEPSACSLTVNQLAEAFTPEFLLALSRRRDFGIRLSADQTRVELDDDCPIWLGNAVALYESELVELMNVSFLGPW
jgi:hypothetical protein